MGRKFLGATRNVLGATFYLETGRSGTCEHCSEAVVESSRVFRSTFRRGFKREHHLVHENCIDGFRAQLEGIDHQVRHLN